MNKCLQMSFCICNSIGRSEIWDIFTSCSKNGNFAVIATTSGNYPKTSLLPVLSQINTIASLFKVKIFKLTSTMSRGFLQLMARHDRSGLTYFVYRVEADPR